MTDQRWIIKSGRVPALLWPDDENPDMPYSFAEADLAEMLPDALDRQVAAAFAALAEVIARDAKVRAEVDETRARCEREQLGHDGTMWEAADLGVAIAALYPEAGK